VDDIGQMLGCGAHVSMLRRTQVANYPADEMITMNDLLALSKTIKDTAESTEQAPDYQTLDKLLLPMDTAVLALPKLYTNAAGQFAFSQGQSVDVEHSIDKEQLVRLYREEHETFLGIATIDDSGRLQPKRVVVYP
jgi:tRNA pseudouridine55 synthase